MTIEKAKHIYEEIYIELRNFEKVYKIYCAIPRFIEIDGVIYQHYQCLNPEILNEMGIRGAQQMKDVMDHQVTFYPESDKEGD
jgi:hypothetical protein